MADIPESSFDVAFDRVVKQALGTPEVPPADVDLLEVGLDSLKFVSLLMELEDEFGGFWPVERLSCFAGLGKVGVLRSATKEQLWPMDGEAPGASGTAREE